jgi:hypothetical protein
MRIVLRNRKSRLYLQPSGEWGADRDTARDFPTSVVAYFWAKEQQLLNVQILLTFADPRLDIACMTVL